MEGAVFSKKTKRGDEERRTKIGAGSLVRRNNKVRLVHPNSLGNNVQPTHPKDPEASNPPFSWASHPKAPTFPPIFPPPSPATNISLFPQKAKNSQESCTCDRLDKKMQKTNLTIPPPFPSPNQTADIRYSSSIAFPNSGQLRSARSAGPNVFRGKPPKEQLGAGVLPKPDLQTRLQSLLLRLETFVVLALSDLLQEGF